jgi:hypothetical protein
VSKQLRKKPSKVGRRKVAPARRRTPKEIVLAMPRQLSDLDQDEVKFAEVLALIETARNRGYRPIKSELVTSYWQLGEYISRNNKRVSALLRQLPWTHHMLILSQAKGRVRKVSPAVRRMETKANAAVFFRGSEKGRLDG